MNFAKKCKKVKVFVHMSTGKCLKPIMFAAVSKNLCEKKIAILISLSFCQKSGTKLLLPFFQNYLQHLLMERDKEGLWKSPSTWGIR